MATLLNEHHKEVPIWQPEKAIANRNRIGNASPSSKSEDRER